ncbi:DMT family transporter [Geminicoccus roseus]|uniref:DMT family transporter n=1 Tax=Geminicoccus roseus TaxID=404900 RepID=UPI0004032D87|nr:DMT family transporter [Geminicoccus roseus]
MTLPLALLLAVGALLGLTANIVKLALQAGWPPLAFLFWATLGAGLLLLLATFLRRDPPGSGRAALAYYLWSGLLSIALPNALFFSAVAHVGAGFVALCLAFPPMATYLLALGFGMERVRATRAAGLALGLAGALVLATGRTGGGGAATFWAIAALTAPLVIAAGNIYRTRRWPQGASALSLAPGMLLGGALLLLPAVLLDGRAWAAGGPEAGWLLLAQIAVFALTYALYFVLQKIAGPVYFSQIGSVGAILGAGVAVLGLGEPAGWPLLAAGGLILAGVVLVNRKVPASR